MSCCHLSTRGLGRCYIRVGKDGDICTSKIYQSKVWGSFPTWLKSVGFHQFNPIFKGKIVEMFNHPLILRLHFWTL